jgi:CheY-like chemotaxis protein
MQILFVDDDLETAKAFAGLVGGKTKFSTGARGNAADALEAVKGHAVSVVVLDQKMPGRSGTDLYKDLLNIRPYMKAVMLSGVADGEDVGEALKLGYIEYVRKDDLGGLIPAIFRAHLESIKASRTSLSSPVFLARRGVGLPLFPRIEYFIDSIEEISGPYVPDTEWRLVQDISAGQSLAVEKTITISKEMLLENTFESGAESSGGLKIDEIVKVEAALKSFLRSTIKSISKESYSQTFSVKTTYTLPAEPTDPKENAVMSRGYYVGPEFIRVRVGLVKKFLPFRDEGYCLVDAVIHTGRFVHKQEDVLRDGTRHPLITQFS